MSALPSSQPVSFMSRHASGYVALFTVSTVVTIAVTRAYLALTGYPQVGGAVFHFAHALWGGLLLAVTTVLLLVSSRPGLRWTCAALGGVGWALFVDEVGKFITQKNDYFFPLAAPIVYVSLLLLALITDRVARRSQHTPQSHLHLALELVDQIVAGEGTHEDLTVLRQHLVQAQASEDERQRTVAQALVDALPVLTEHACDRPTRATRLRHSALAWEQRWLPVERQRRLGRALLTLFATVGVVLIATAAMVSFGDLPSDSAPVVVNNYELGSLSQIITVAGMATWVIGGLLALWAVVLMRPGTCDVRRPRQLAMASLLLLIVLGNGLMAYVDQFATLADLCLQALTLVVVVRWSDRRQAELAQEQLVEE